MTLFSSLQAPSERAPLARGKPWVGMVVLAAAMLQVGCASFPPPNEQLAVATAAVDNAARAGAAELATADLNTARDKLSRANASMIEKKYERAQMLAEAALVDARLAEARARHATAAKAALALRDGNRVLRQEIDRGAAQ